VADPTPEEVRTLAAAAGLRIPDAQLEAFTRALARVRALARELHALHLDGVPPWTPPR
jgi:Asp-tRNA(Asn)/Glu-tRNA(Gln) amidotransferase C subunit